MKPRALRAWMTAGFVTLGLIGAAGRLVAATFVVNSTADAVDANPGDGVCANAGGFCTLRAAIQEANALGGADAIILPAGTYVLNRGSGDDNATNGDLDITTSLTLTGAGARTTIVDGNALDRVIDVLAGTVALSGVTITNGDAGGNDGGGLRVDASAMATLTDAAVTGSAGKDGGGIQNSGTITLLRVSLSGNNASNRGGGTESRGGGSLAYLTNVTISGNTSGNDGGGAAFDHAELLNLTLTNNSSPGQALRKSGSQPFTMKNTIIADNAAGAECGGGAMTSLGYNIGGDASCGLTGPGDLPNTDPLLDTLQDNGGPTDTHEPLVGSPIVDNGTATGAPATDQRGIARPQKAGYDIGAFEKVLAKIKGKVFEDVSYGGGAGRSLAASGGVGRPSARAELFDGGGNFVTSASTDADGLYAFSDLWPGTYYVRVVSGSVTSSRAGYTAAALSVQTFRTDGTTGTAVAVTDWVGGTDPAVTDPGNASPGTLMNTVTYVLTAGLSGTAHAVATVAVTSDSVTGVDFGFNFDTIVATRDAGQGSLRQFIANANLLSNAGLAQQGRPVGVDNAIWMIGNGTAAPGLRATNNYFAGGVTTIRPTTALPAITDPVVLDAQTQPGWTTRPIVQLSGNAVAAAAHGLDITAGSSAVRGLVINRYAGVNMAGIRLAAGGGNTIQGCWVGTDSTGAAAAANYQGVLVSASNGNAIGGTGAGQSNVLSGNTWRGILFAGGATTNVLRGNHVGLNAAGTAAVANAIGVYFNASPGDTVGGTAAGAGNVISGNSQIGLYLVFGGTTGTVVEGNAIGLDAARVAAVPNGVSGIEICCVGDGSSGNRIGGTAAGAGNLIASNGGSGVVVRDGTGNAFLGNPIHGNGGIGIDLDADGVTLNDGAKNGALPNSGMDYTVITSATILGTTLTVAGYVGSAPGQPLFASARVEVFESDGDATGYGEGLTYLGFLTADASGNFGGSLTVSGIVAGDRINATATDGSNNTSEFGPQALVGATIAGTVFEDGNYGGGAGRSLAASAGLGRPGARVELYDAGGAFVTATVTDAAGGYRFAGLSAGTYYVRAVVGTVTSSRAGYTASAAPVQTYRGDASGGAVAAVVDQVGGTNPALTDPGNGSPGTVMNPATFVFTAGLTGTALSVAPVAVTATGLASLGIPRRQ